MEVKIKRNDYISRWEEEKRSAAIVGIVNDVLGQDAPQWELYAGKSIYDVMEDLGTVRQMKDVALLCFSSDWNFAIEALKGCKIVVDGYCPYCGIEMEERSEQTDNGTDYAPHGYVNYLVCPKCNYSTR